MAAIKLPRIPDRQPVKYVVHLSPDLEQRLKDYATAYEGAYGRAETVTDLIPAMLAAYLESDREFSRRAKAR